MIKNENQTETAKRESVNEQKQRKNVTLKQWLASKKLNLPSRRLLLSIFW